MRLLALPRRIWKRLHPFTWLVMAVVGAGLVIIVVPGEKQSVWDMEIEKETHWAFTGAMSGEEGPDHRVDISLHGWPRSAVARAVYVPYPSTHSLAVPSPPLRSAPRVVPYWTHADNWPLSANQWIVNWPNLALDLVLVALLLAVVGAGTEFWLWRRGGLWRFRIVDLLVLITVGAGIASWYQGHLRSKAAEEQVNAYIATGKTGLSRLDQCIDWQPHGQYRGPVWMRRLLGHDDYLSVLCHPRVAELEITESWPQDLAQLKRLTYLEELEVVGVIPEGIVEELARLPRLKVLKLAAHRQWVYSHAQEYWDAFPDSERLQPCEFDQLRVLPLIELWIESHDFLAEDVKCVARSMPHLESLYLQHVPINSREMKGLKAEYPFLVYFEDFNSSAMEIARRRDDLKRQRAERLEQESKAR